MCLLRSHGDVYSDPQHSFGFIYIASRDWYPTRQNGFRSGSVALSATWPFADTIISPREQPLISCCGSARKNIFDMKSAVDYRFASPGSKYLFRYIAVLHALFSGYDGASYFREWDHGSPLYHNDV